MNDAKSVEERLRGIMHAWQMPIDPGCEYHLSQQIVSAAQLVDAQGEAGNQGRIAEAESNFRKLLTEMTWEAGVMGLTELHEPTFFRAKSRLCPLWPFC